MGGIQRDLQMRTMEAIKCYGKYIYININIYTTHIHIFIYIQRKHVDKILQASVIKKTKKNKQLENK